MTSTSHRPSPQPPRVKASLTFRLPSFWGGNCRDDGSGDRLHQGGRFTHLCPPARSDRPDEGLKREAEAAAPAEEVRLSVSCLLLTDFPFLPHLWLQPGVFLLTSSCDCGGHTQLFMALLEPLDLTAREEEKEKIAKG